MPSTSPDGPPRRRTGIGRIVFSVIAVLTVLAASAFSIRSASGGNDIRTNLTLIAPAAAGGGWDSFQRELQQTMRVNGLVNNVQVVNIPGAGGNIALGQLTTLEDANNLMVGGTGQIAAHAARGTGPELSQVTAVSRVVEEYSLVVVPADSPYQSMDDLVSAWRADPAHVAWTGGGSFDQLVMADIARTAGVPVADTTYIPSDGGGEAIQALLNGTAQASAGGFADIYPQVEAGRLRALGVVAAEPLGLPAGEVARRLDVPPNTMSAHLATLSHAGLVAGTRASRFIIYRADLAQVQALTLFLLKDCCGGNPTLCAPVLAALAPCCEPAPVPPRSPVPEEATP